MTQPNLLRPIEIHRRYGIPRDRIYTAIHTGELPAVDFGTKNKHSFLIALIDLEAWLHKLKNWRNDPPDQEAQ